MESKDRIRALFAGILGAGLCVSTFFSSAYAEERIIANINEEGQAAIKSAPLYAQDTPTSGWCGPNARWTIAAGVLSIAGAGDITKPDWYVTDFNDPSSPYAGVDVVQIDNGITSICEAAFIGGNVKDISIPPSVTYISMGSISITSNLTIYGSAGTEAERFAKANGVRFIAAESQDVDNPNKLTTTLLSGMCGPKASWSISGKTLSIGGMGAITAPNWHNAVDTSGKSYLEIGIDTVYISSGITSICGNAFTDNIPKKVTIPESVTEINYETFFYPDAITIYGYTNSYAEEFASQHKIDFVALDMKTSGAAYLPSSDGWGFSNREAAQGFDRISYGDFRKVFWGASCPRAEKEMMSYTMYNLKVHTTDNGWCHGMSLASILTFYGMPEWSTWHYDPSVSYDGPSRIASVGTCGELRNEQDGIGSLGEWVRKLHFTQYSPTFCQYSSSYTNMFFDRPSATIAEISSCLENHKPIVLSLGGKEQHTVVPYRLEKGSDHTKIYVYDPNRPYDDKAFVTINTSDGTWQYGSWNSTDGDKLGYYGPDAVMEAAKLASVSNQQIKDATSAWLLLLGSGVSTVKVADGIVEMTNAAVTSNSSKQVYPVYEVGASNASKQEYTALYINKSAGGATISCSDSSSNGTGVILASLETVNKLEVSTSAEIWSGVNGETCSITPLSYASVSFLTEDVNGAKTKLETKSNGRLAFETADDVKFTGVERATITNESGNSVSISGLDPKLTYKVTPGDAASKPSVAISNTPIQLRDSTSNPSNFGSSGTSSLVNGAGENNSSSETTNSASNKVRRVSGSSRYDTMSAIINEGFTQSDWAVVASGSKFPDSLTASALAGARGCPVVLTKKGHLSAQARDQLVRLGVKSVYLVGGTGTLSADVEGAIRGMGISVTRLAGNNRYGTCLEAYKETRRVNSSSDTLIVASGRKFADALSIGPWSYAKFAPIVLARKDGRLSDYIVAAVKADPGIRRVLIIGGVSVVSDEVRAQLGDGYTYERIGGTTRYETSERVARWSSNNGLGWSRVALSTGKKFPDALSAAALCGRHTSVLLLVDGASDPTVSVLSSRRDAVDTCYVLGGEGAFNRALATTIVNSLS